MDKQEAYATLETLTPKQHETLILAARHFTSKQIAQQLGVAPVTIDKRIEAVRGKLGALPRTSLLQLYGEWYKHDGQIIDEPIILGFAAAPGPEDVSQPSGQAFVFEDSLTFDARASWERSAGWRRSGFSPSDLGVAGKLLAMIFGAVAMLMAAVLSLAFANALMAMFEA
jgi:DNA-binding CsgD family transcriptional regulator